jgi:glycosyltransferase involved in cell wall biosynthesis
MRILFVEHTSIVSGGQRSLLELIRALGREHDVVLACPRGEFEGLARRLGVSVVAIPESQITFKLHPRHSLDALMRMLAAAWRLSRVIRSLRPGVVHANSVRAGLIGTLAVPRRVALVVHCRDAMPAGRLGRAVRAVVLARSDQVVAISRHVARSFAGPTWRARGVRVVDNAVDVNRFDPELIKRASSRLAVGVRDKPVLTVLGQLTPWKGQDLAIRVLAELRDRLPSALLLLAGEAKFVSDTTRYDNRAFERRLHELSEELQLAGRVRFLGERLDPERILAATDVLLVPSIEEPFGRTIIEAMAMGVPVAATCAGGPPEILRDGIDGRLVEGRDPSGWASVVEELLGWPRDRRGAARAQAATRFSPSRHARIMAGVYEEAITRAPRARH